VSRGTANPRRGLPARVDGVRPPSAGAAC
jgi:hypothetical protein